MKAVPDRVKHMRFTAGAVGLSFITMMFILFSMGVDWYRPKNGRRSTLFYSVSRNTGWAKSAGDPAFAFIVLAILAFIVAIMATYNRWSGSPSRLPHTWQATSGYYGVCSFCLFLAFVIYAGKANAANSRPDGQYGGGFGIAIIMWLVTALFAYLIYHFRQEVDRHNDGPGAAAPAAPAPGVPPQPTVDGTNPIGYEHKVDPKPLTQIKDRWAKLKTHSIILAVDLFFILLIIVTLGSPWFDAKGPGTYGLLEQHFRHTKGSALRKAGDATFAFVLFAMFAQLYSTMAITLRFLGRNDKFSGRVPHGLTACLVSTGVSSFCCFLSFCVYAGTFNDKKPSGTKGHFGGGLALMILNWLFTMAILAILYFKRAEVDNAPKPDAPADGTDQVYPPPQPSYQPNPYGPGAAGTYTEPQPGAFSPAGQPVTGAPVNYEGTAQPTHAPPVVGYDTTTITHDDKGAGHDDPTV